nr:MAG TPA: hypothetical protein [Caudoviricetes sp.]
MRRCECFSLRTLKVLWGGLSRAGLATPKNHLATDFFKPDFLFHKSYSTVRAKGGEARAKSK